MIEKIIITFGLIVGILLYKKTQPTYLKVILTGMIVCFLLKYFDSQITSLISFYLFGIMSFGYLVFSGKRKNWLNFIIALFAFISFFFKFNHYPYASLLKLVMIIPVMCYLISISKFKSKENEFSILTILAFYEFSELLKLFEFQTIN